jgi:hypothetical protein
MGGFGGGRGARDGGVRVVGVGFLVGHVPSQADDDVGHEGFGIRVPRVGVDVGVHLDLDFDFDLVEHVDHSCGPDGDRDASRRRVPDELRCDHHDGSPAGVRVGPCAGVGCIGRESGGL